MLITTPGIVFRVVKYRETSIITGIYTRELGLADFLANGVRSSRGKFNIGYFEPLSLVEITAYYRPQRDIHRLREVKALRPLHRIRQDIRKSTISLFLAEVLNKCIAEQDANPALFHFLEEGITTLDSPEASPNFHLQFLLKLTSFLGFGISDTATFIGQAINPQFYQPPALSRALQQLWQAGYGQSPALSNTQRQTILEDILNYYRQQAGLPGLRSLEVLQAVFSQTG